MSEQPPYIPEEEQVIVTEKLVQQNIDVTGTREEVLARIETSDGGFPTLLKAREYGASETKLEEYAKRFLTKDILEGYSLGVILDIAKGSGVVTPDEAKELYERIKAEMAAAGPVVQTEAEKAEAAAKWLEEMLASYE